MKQYQFAQQKFFFTGIPSCRIQVGTREVRSAELRRPIAHYKQLYELYRPYYSYQAYIRTDDQEPFRHCK